MFDPERETYTYLVGRVQAACGVLRETGNGDDATHYLRLAGAVEGKTALWGVVQKAEAEAEAALELLRAGDDAIRATAKVQHGMHDTEEQKERRQLVADLIGCEEGEEEGEMDYWLEELEDYEAGLDDEAW